MAAKHSFTSTYIKNTKFVGRSQILGKSRDHCVFIKTDVIVRENYVILSYSIKIKTDMAHPINIAIMFIAP